jgi:TPP-dependent pyruvate/acetoin dehydrogenase alpha subunit
VCRHAAEKARRGDGPTFIELLTYRVSAHSSSDDPSRYRDEAVTDVWKRRRDPLARLRIYMEGRDWLASGEYDAMATAFEARVREVIAEVEAAGPPPLASLIEDVYETPTWIQREQLSARNGE